jgi:hypothetical protein
LIVHRDGRAREVVEQAFHALMEERRPVLHALMLAAGADGLVERIVEARRAEALAVAGAEAGDAVLVEDHLGGGGELHGVDAFGGPLALDLEAARAVEHVAEQVEPDGRAAPGGNTSMMPPRTA